MVGENESQKCQRPVVKGAGLVLKSALRVAKSVSTAALGALLVIELLHLSIEVEATKELLRIPRNALRRMRTS